MSSHIDRAGQQRFRDGRTADPSADGRRSAAIFPFVELPSAGAYRLVAAEAIPCCEHTFLLESFELEEVSADEPLEDVCL